MCHGTLIGLLSHCNCTGRHSSHDRDQQDGMPDALVLLNVLCHSEPRCVARYECMALPRHITCYQVHSTQLCNAITNVKSQLHDACFTVPACCHYAVNIAGQAEKIVLVSQWCHVACRAARVSMTERFAPPVVAKQIIAEFQRIERARAHPFSSAV